MTRLRFAIGMRSVAWSLVGLIVALNLPLAGVALGAAAFAVGLLVLLKGGRRWAAVPVPAITAGALTWLYSVVILAGLALQR
jgi:hypothetical protein